MPKSFPTFQYRIDHVDRFVWVDNEWLGFAQENGVTELTEQSVLGQSLWGFIGDDVTRRLYQQIHAKVRASSKPFVLPIRCDSPTLLREMQLCISPEPVGHLLYASTLQSVKIRPNVAILDKRHSRAQSVLTMCSCCLKCLIEPDGWLEIEIVAQRFPGFHGQRVPKLRYTVCQRCRNFAVDPTNGTVA